MSTPDDGGFGADLDVLHQAETGIEQAQRAWSDLVPLGGDVAAEWGVGLTAALQEYDGATLGHQGLAQALSQLGQRWDGPLGQAQRANAEARQGLAAAIETYARTDDQVEQQLLRIEREHAQGGGAGGDQ